MPPQPHRAYADSIVDHVTNTQARGATIKLMPR
jgi:hypothetical protein